MQRKIFKYLSLLGILFVMTMLVGCVMIDEQTKLKFVKFPDSVYRLNLDTEGIDLEKVVIQIDNKEYSLKDAKEQGVVVTGNTFDSVGMHTLIVSYGNATISYTYEVVKGGEYIPSGSKAYNSSTKEYYTSIKEALKTAEDGNTIVLLIDETITLNDTGASLETCDRSLWFTQSNITLDLNDHVLTTRSNNGGSNNVLNIYGDNWTVKNGAIIAKRGENYAENDSYALAVQGAGHEFRMEDMNLTGGLSVHAKAIANVYESRFVMGTNFYSIYAETGAVVNVYNGRYKLITGSNNQLFWVSGSIINIYDGTFETNSNNISSLKGGEGKLNIVGGTFNVDPSSVICDNCTASSIDGNYKVNVNPNCRIIKETSSKNIYVLKDEDLNSDGKLVKGTYKEIAVSDVSELIDKEYTQNENGEIIKASTEKNVIVKTAEDFTIALTNNVEVINITLDANIVFPSTPGQYFAVVDGKDVIIELKGYNLCSPDGNPGYYTNFIQIKNGTLTITNTSDNQSIIQAYEIFKLESATLDINGNIKLDSKNVKFSVTNNNNWTIKYDSSIVFSGGQLFAGGESLWNKDITSEEGRVIFSNLISQ